MMALGYSSLRYGPCEVCGEYCSDVWLRWVGQTAVFDHRHHGSAS